MSGLTPYGFVPELGFHIPIDDLRPAPGWADERPRRHDRPLGEIVGLEGVSKEFDGPRGRLKVLDGVDLSIRRGEIFGIMGRSGSGKSTLIRCINLLERPTAGDVIYEGEVVQDLAARLLPAYRRKTGMVFQHFNLLSSRTVYDNVALPMRLAERSAWEIANRVPTLLELVGLTDKADFYPATLSGGQKQRVGIARALTLQPDILLCDEAASTPDSETTEQILDLLRDINHRLGVTIVLITHEAAVVRQICDRLAVLEAGRIQEEGSVWDCLLHPRSEVTRLLLNGLLPDLPESIRSRLTPLPLGPAQAILRLRFGGKCALDPVVADFARDIGASFSVIHGAIDRIQDRPLGVLYLALETSDPDEVSGHIAYLQTRVLDVEVLGYVPSIA
jgi:D-methionine transport system ATP-binding protein